MSYIYEDREKKYIKLYNLKNMFSTKFKKEFCIKSLLAYYNTRFMPSRVEIVRIFSFSGIDTVLNDQTELKWRE